MGDITASHEAKLEIKHDEIFEYLRRHKGGQVRKVGILVGRKNANHEIRIGWSKCNFKMGDKFDFARGWMIATDRMTGKVAPSVPLCLNRHLRRFAGRCIRYFKGANCLIMPF